MMQRRNEVESLHPGAGLPAEDRLGAEEVWRDRDLRWRPRDEHGRAKVDYLGGGLFISPPGYGPPVECEHCGQQYIPGMRAEKWHTVPLRACPCGRQYHPGSPQARRHEGVCQPAAGPGAG
jgi:hypothetical protein